MTEHYRDHRKIDPARLPVDPEGVEIGPTELALSEWAEAGLELPDLAAMRAFRLERLVSHVVARGYGGVLLFDPMNIRYATDSTNMQIWNMHNPFRAVLVCADGWMVMWDYRNCAMLSAHNPLVREVRGPADLFYFDRGDRVDAHADRFAAEVVALLVEHGGGNLFLAADKPMPHAFWALEAAGATLFEGEELTERARAVKGPEEIVAMRCAVHACEAAVAEMQAAARPGLSENEIWAHLHAGNIRRGGEWIETRLLTSGPRTNPWFQECGPRVVRDGEILAFDTDLVGCYGICVDISRTWWIGGGRPRADMIDAMRHAVEHIRTNMEMIAPGVPIPELVRRSHRLAPEYQARKYGCLMHGVGLCDEWPLVAYPDLAVDGAFDHVLEPGNVLCVEALVGLDGGDFCIKLEDQVLVTETGYERLSTYPLDAALMGTA